MELLKLLNLNEIAAQLVCFIMVFFLLRRFAWKRILKALDDRKARIASEFEKIEELRRQTEIVKARYQEQLDRIDEAARTKIKEAVAEGARVAEEIRRKAQEDAAQAALNAKEQIRFEMVKAREDLRTSIVELAIGAAEKIVMEKISAEKERQLVDDFLKEAEKIK